MLLLPQTMNRRRCVENKAQNSANLGSRLSHGADFLTLAVLNSRDSPKIIPKCTLELRSACIVVPATEVHVSCHQEEAVQFQTKRKRC